MDNSISELLARMRDYDGYARQAAIEQSVRLAHPDVLPSIAERLNDWVPQVRDSARAAMIALLSSIPAHYFVALLPTIAHLRNAGRFDHSAWLSLFEHEMLKWLQLDDLITGVNDANIKTARANFDMLERHALIDAPSLVLLAVNSKRDIVLALRGATLIATLPPHARSALLIAASTSHFGAVRTLAVRALLAQSSDTAAHDHAMRFLLDPQSSARWAAVNFLLAANIDVRSHYRQLLESSLPTAPIIRICLTALAGLRNRNDIGLISSYTANPVISIRAAAYASWLKLDDAEKDSIASRAVADEAASIRRLSMQMTLKQKAYIRFDTVLAALAMRQDWNLLLQFTQSEAWNSLEAIARIGLATGTLPPALMDELQRWMNGMGGRHRPRPAQVEFLLADSTIEVLSHLTAKHIDVAAYLRREVALAMGMRR